MKNSLSVVILAGGLATRLRPVTEKIPKSLIDINGEPFIAHQLRLLQKNGIKKVVLCVGFLGEQIESFVGDGRAFGLKVSYSYDGPRLLGTAGAIKQALPLLNESFFVMYGDSYLPCDYASIQTVFEQSGKQALMTVFKNQGLWDKSNIEYSNGRIIIYDKIRQTDRMHYIDYGLGMFHSAVFDDISVGQPYDLAALYQQVLLRNELAAYEVSQRFYEIGSLMGQKELSDYLFHTK